MKKLITLALASTTALMLAGCGATDSVAIDNSLMGDGTSAQTGLGGYWWTYVDRSGLSSVIPNTGKVNPTDAASSELNPGLSQGPGKGLEDDGTGNLAYHVTGTVAFAPKWSSTLGADGIATNYTATNPTLNWVDPYVDANYGALCKDGKCGEVKYPAAGLGFGFHASNKILGPDSKDGAGAPKVGISFRMKLGAGHGQTKVAGTPNDIAISLPLDLTDVPDPSFGDQYGTDFAQGTLASGATATAGKNVPFCSFPFSLKADGSVVGGPNKTCFGNLATIISPVPTTTWTNYCVTWEAFVPPGWASAGLTAAGLTSLSTFVDRIIKMQFDAYKPAEAETVNAPFDFWVDDVYLLDASNQATHCAGATQIVSTPAL
jgi:hypothetical protein